MARISGVDLPRDKRIEIALTYIFGIGRKTADDIIAATGINPDTRVKDLTEDDVSKLREYIDHHVKVEGDLRREVALNIKRMVEIDCYRGRRHKNGLPVRGFQGLWLVSCIVIKYISSCRQQWYFFIYEIIAVFKNIPQALHSQMAFSHHLSKHTLFYSL